MTFQYMSDLHLEFPDAVGLLPEIPVKADTLVLAGDICTVFNSDRLEKFLLDQAKKFKKVLYIPGNHEYYFSKVKRTKKILNEICDKADNLELMDKKSLMIGNIRVLGCTLFTDIIKEYENDVVGGLADFMSISIERESGKTEVINVEDYRKFYNTDLTWLTKELKKARKNKEKVLVVTHHPPLYEKVCPPQYEGSRTTPGFATDLRKYIKKNSDVIKVWITGHTHWNFKFDVSGVKVVSNQCGYLKKNKPEEKCKDFNLEEVITVI